jgi:hypothetical protein
LFFKPGSGKKFVDLSLQNFAYTSGGYDPMSKFVISKIYDSARSVEPGINSGEIDLALLKSVTLYVRHVWINSSQLLEKLDRQGDWLIFRTHNVRQAPSP